jgi:hypothetical protein
MNFMALPYYAGELGRKANGALAAVRLSDFRAGEMFARLTVFKPALVTENVMVGLWGMYVVGTAMLIGIAVWISWGGVQKSSRDH